MSNYKVLGHFFEKNSSTAYKAELHLHDNSTVTLIVHRESENHPPSEAIGTFPKSQLSIEPKLGDIPRDITFPNGYHFTPLDNHILHTWLSEHPAGFFDWVHRLETQKRYLIAMLVVVPAMLWVLFTRGIPAAAESIANSFSPETITSILSINAEDLSDFQDMTVSSIPQETQERITRLFEQAQRIASVNAFDYELHFYLIASQPELLNAFALPNGNIVVTDGLVNQLTDDEILSVLLHEIGHVEERHGMTMLIEYSFAAIAYSFLIGGQEDVQNVLVSVNNMLIQTQFSRSMESEADTFALTKLKEAGISPLVFASALQKLKDYNLDEETEATSKNDDSENGIIDTIVNSDWFSTHPDIDKRIERAKNAAINP